MDVKLINKWLRDNHFDVKVIESEESEYDHGNQIIYFNSTEDEEITKDQVRYFKRRGLTNYSKKVVVFLHELGHSQTMDDANIFNQIVDKVLRNILYYSPTPNRTIQLLKYYLYHMLPLEKWATSWAVNYMLNNKEEVSALEEIFN